MEWLAVKYKNGDGFLFVQSRNERSNQISVLIDEGITVGTIVIKGGFKSDAEAKKYCDEINQVTQQLRDIFP